MKGVIVWEWVKHINNRQLWKTLWEKKKLLVNKQFFLFTKCFLLSQIIESSFIYLLDIISSFAAEFEKPKIGISGRGLNHGRIKSFCPTTDFIVR